MKPTGTRLMRAATRAVASTLIPISAKRGTSLFCASALACSIVNAADLVLQYDFEKHTPAVVVDTSGNGLHGEIWGSSPNCFGTGFSRKALKLGGIDDMLLVPDDPLLDVDAFSLLAWVRYTPSGWDRFEVMEKAGAFWINIRADTKRVRAGGFFGGCVASSYWMNVDSAARVLANEWTHVAATYDGYDLRVFVNGVESGAVGVRVQGPVCRNTEPLVIGAKYRTIPPPTEEAFYKGLIDSVRVFDAALSEVEIRREMFRNH
jgi:hypothetical protein